jgi:hypothetical protein
VSGEALLRAQEEFPPELTACAFDQARVVCAGIRHFGIYCFDNWRGDVAELVLFRFPRWRTAVVDSARRPALWLVSDTGQTSLGFSLS